MMDGGGARKGGGKKGDRIQCNQQQCSTKANKFNNAIELKCKAQKVAGK
jgi:hypothetical protein